MILAWIASNWSWIAPSVSLIWSEYLGWKSGGEKASVSQVLWDLIQKALLLIKK